MLENAWIIPLLPAASFALILLFGKRMPRGGSELGIAAVGLAFVLALLVNFQWFDRVDDQLGHGDVAASASEVAAGTDLAGGGAPPVLGAAPEGRKAIEPVTRSWTWWESGDVTIEVGMLLDGPAVMMLFVVTLVSLLVHVYSTDYVAGDRRYTHFFAFLSLFTASMLGLVMAENTLMLIVMWELVGVCSFVLIGHWWEEKANSDAALKAFITNRVGDIGLLIGVIVLFFGAGGTFNIVEINQAAVAGDISHLVLLVAACCLIAAVMSKSGQFILHTWLPDAMAGPTPVSALIHAATMVVAGIFMVGRLYPVFFEGLQIGVSSVNLLAAVGAVTVIGGAGLAFVQTDIKKVLAYSTVSQLGYMVMALGVGAWTPAFFHLFTHAFFKACLFLGAGSVSHAVHSFDMKADMGGLRRWMPHTHRTFMISTASLIGIFPLAGFWSKDEILASAQQLGGVGNYTAFLVVGLIGALMTAAYMTRCVYLVFYGEHRGHGHPHESGPRIVVPLYVLGALAVVAGFTNIPNTGVLSWWPENLALRFKHYYEPKGDYFVNVLDTFAHPTFSLGVALAATVVAVAGVGAGYLWYSKGLGPHGITERNRLARAGYRLLENRYYFDHLYSGVIAAGFKGPIARGTNWFDRRSIDAVVDGTGRSAARAGHWVYDRIDQGLIDASVDGTGAVTEGSGEVARQMQSGRVQSYGAWLFAGAAVLAGIFIIVV
jgi:NADH-quinone oxidoreductase subunit L